MISHNKFGPPRKTARGWDRYPRKGAENREFVLEAMMMGLGGDLDFGRLRGQQDSTTDN